MQVLQFKNASGKAVANHVIIIHNNKQYFQSYNTIIAEVDTINKKIVLYNGYNYSNTTSKHLFNYLLSITSEKINTNNLSKCLKAEKIGGYSLQLIIIDKKI